MDKFAQLFTKLDQSNKTNDKLAALKDYFETAPKRDVVWAIGIFTGKRPRRQVKQKDLIHAAQDLAEIPDWLFSETYLLVADTAETISLIVPGHSQTDESSKETLTEAIAFLNQLSKLEPELVREKLQEKWLQQSQVERFVFTKLVTGGFRVGVSKQLVARALAAIVGVDDTVMQQRLMGDWQPGTVDPERFFAEEGIAELASQPYPFFLAHQLNDPALELAEPGEWAAEWKWDGIRGQIVRRAGETHVWSRGEELVTDKFPELISLGENLDDGTVLDGEIIAHASDAGDASDCGHRDSGKILPFSKLQQRIGRKNLTKKILSEVPVKFLSYDLLELKGKDLRDQPLRERRTQLEKLVATKSSSTPELLLSKLLDFSDWGELAEFRKESQAQRAEGLMLKRWESPYQSGRKRGDWWKWKLDPLTIDAVLIYAQSGRGRRAGLFTDYTFAVWKDQNRTEEKTGSTSENTGNSTDENSEKTNPELVPFTKAYSGLTEAEITEVDKFIKANVREKFGPVRSVKPKLVFEIAFEGIQASSRHKSGVALRFPRIARWRRDKPAAEANTLADLKEMLDKYGS